MAEYLVKEESLTAIADQIRILSGTGEAMSLDEMATNVGEANTEVDSQADLIVQIKSAVDNLPEAGSNGGSVNYDTCTVNITASFMMSGVAYLTVNANGELEPTIITTNATSYNFTCVCNSFIVVGVSLDSSSDLINNADYFGYIYSGSCRLFTITASNGETATIAFKSGSGSS